MACKHCGSTRFVKAGLSRKQQRYKCKSCLRHFTNTPPRGRPPAMKALAILLYSFGNMSYRMIGQLLGVSAVAVYKRVRKAAEALAKPTIDADVETVLLDEMWHFVNGKKNPFGRGAPMILLQGEPWPGCWVGVMMKPSESFSTRRAVPFERQVRYKRPPELVLPIMEPS